MNQHQSGTVHINETSTIPIHTSCHRPCHYLQTGTPGVLEGNQVDLYQVEFVLTRHPFRETGELPKWGLSISCVQGKYFMLINVPRVKGGNKVAALCPGDCIVSVDGKGFSSMRDICQYLGTLRQIRMLVIRSRGAGEVAKSIIGIGAGVGGNTVALFVCKRLIESINRYRHCCVVLAGRCGCREVSCVHLVYKDSLDRLISVNAEDETNINRLINYRHRQLINKRKMETENVAISNNQNGKEEQLVQRHPLPGLYSFEGQRKRFPLNSAQNLEHWLVERKKTWRMKWSTARESSRQHKNVAIPNNQNGKEEKPEQKYPLLLFYSFEGQRERFFILNSTQSMDQWLVERKNTWRRKWSTAREKSRQINCTHCNEYFSCPFDDELDIVNDPDCEGTAQFLPQISSFPEWLQDRKNAWRLHVEGVNCEKAEQFLPQILSFPEWLQSRKESWRKDWTLDFFSYSDEESLLSSSRQNLDFWSSQGYESFDDWLFHAATSWRRSYSWQRKKRKRIQENMDVSFPSIYDLSDSSAHIKKFTRWLDVRKHQWLISRRKRKRKLFMSNSSMPEMHDDNKTSPKPLGSSSTIVRKEPLLPSPFSTNGDSSSLQGDKLICGDFPNSPRSVLCKKYSFLMTSNLDARNIDALLAEEEREEYEFNQKLSSRGRFNILFIFDSSLGCPDEVVAKIFRYLPLRDHGKMLCISYATSERIKKRSLMWHSLCPPHWILPKRPRKSWALVYITKLREEEEMTRKMSDEILVKASKIIFKGDNLRSVKKLVIRAEQNFARFSINYVSAIVLERSSLLNMAIMHRRMKIVRWLIEEKCADIETTDRGGFTPLLNAAYMGDKFLVRLLLSKGCDRYKLGTEHSTTALAPIGTKGKTAEEWARDRGHLSVAELIRYGI